MMYQKKGMEVGAGKETSGLSWTGACRRRTPLLVCQLVVNWLSIGYQLVINWLSTGYQLVINWFCQLSLQRLAE
jgi:hypothetical protein